MLAFLPPMAGPPRRDVPEPPRGSALGIGLAIALTVAGMLLPWLRPHGAPSAPDVVQTGDRRAVPADAR